MKIEIDPELSRVSMVYSDAAMEEHLKARGLKPFFICVIDLPKHTIKKNSRKIMRNFRTGQPFIGKNEDAARAETSMTKRFFYEKQTQGIIAPFAGRVWMKAIFVFKREDYFTKKGPIAKNLPDLSNLYQLPEDCLQAAQVILNDTQIDSHDGSRRIPGDSTRLELKLYSMPS